MHSRLRTPPVNERLLNYVEGGSNADIAGAVAALYWASMPIAFKAMYPTFALEHATPESRSVYLELATSGKETDRLF